MPLLHGSPSGYTYYGCRCVACSTTASERGKRYRERNPPTQAEYKQKLVKGRTISFTRRLARRTYIQEKKNVPCADCGQSFPPFVMDFDHVPERGRRSFEISRWASGNGKHDLIDAELTKCDVVCANCHRFRTASRAAQQPRKL